MPPDINFRTDGVHPPLQQSEVQHVPLSPVSERNAESSRDSQCSNSPHRQSYVILKLRLRHYSLTYVWNAHLLVCMIETFYTRNYQFIECLLPFIVTTICRLNFGGSRLSLTGYQTLIVIHSHWRVTRTSYWKRFVMSNPASLFDNTRLSLAFL